jgi:hypothetical protein
MATFPALTPGTLLALQTNAISGAGIQIATIPRFMYHVFICTGTGTITGGTISIEEAADPSYTGTWSVIQTVTATTLTAGAASAVHITGCYLALQARISVAIAGGGSISVSVAGWGSN